MPLYTYKCEGCGKIFDQFQRLADYEAGDKPNCEGCGSADVIRHFAKESNPAIQCDSINDVTWLPSACKVLQRDGEKPIESRSEYKQYLKDNRLVCKG